MKLAKAHLRSRIRPISGGYYRRGRQVSRSGRALGRILSRMCLPSFRAETLRAAARSVMVAIGMGPLRWHSSLQRRGRAAVQGKRTTSIAAGVVLGLLAAACGHPASEEECRVILERIVELELKSQKVNDPNELAKRRNEALGISPDGGRSDMLEGCVGRHITDRALTCVKNAETASDITEHCLQ